MWKMETNLGVLEDLRRTLSQTSPELVDLGMRIASVKATAMDWGLVGIWADNAATVYLTDAEYLAVKDAAPDLGVYEYLGRNRYGHPLRRGAYFRHVKMRTDFGT